MRRVGKNYGNVLSTTEAGKICGVCCSTVQNWVTKNMIKFHTVGTGEGTGKRNDLRFFRSDVYEFMIKNELPIFPSDILRVIVIDNTVSDSEKPAIVNILDRAGHVVEHVRSAFEAGIVVHRLLPHIVIINTDSKDVVPANICKINASKKITPIIKTIAINTKTNNAETDGFSAIITEPHDKEHILYALETALVAA